MKRFVDGVETELTDSGDRTFLGDRWLLRTPDGSFTGVAVRVGQTTWISYRGRQYKVEASQSRGVGPSVGSGDLRAAMPGQVVDVKVASGDSVAANSTVLVIEAMKTQQPYLAPFDGVVEWVRVGVGDQVSEGQELALIVASEPQ